MWVRRSAIRAIPPYALVPARAVQAVLKRVADVSKTGSDWIAGEQERFEGQQPALVRFLRSEAPLALDPQAVSLSEELSVALFLMFEAAHKGALKALSSEAVSACEGELRADEELRAKDPVDPLDSEDIVAIEQPELLGYLNEQIEALLVEQAGAIDVDDVGQVFRSLLVAVLALSEAVVAPRGVSRAAARS